MDTPILINSKFFIMKKSKKFSQTKMISSGKKWITDNEYKRW